MEKADGLSGRRRRQTNQERVEIQQHLTPQLVNGAMALVHDDEVKKLWWDARVVNHFWRRPLPRLGRIECGTLLVLRIEIGLPLQHRKQPLNRRDDDLGGRIDRVRLEPLHGVKLRELTRVVDRLKRGELVLRLLAEVAAIHQKQNAFRAGELQQSIASVDGSEGYSFTPRLCELW